MFALKIYYLLSLQLMLTKLVKKYPDLGSQSLMYSTLCFINSDQVQ